MISSDFKRRVLVLCIGLAVAGGVLWVNETHRPNQLNIAQGMLGGQWFRIDLGHQHVGYMFNDTQLKPNGSWTFNSTTHFLLQGNAANTITKSLTFSGHPPYDLTYASFKNSDGVQTELLHTGSTYSASIHRGSESSEIELDWDFTLKDFLGFEAWLSEHQPKAGASHAVRDPDFEKLRIVQRSYRILELNEQGYVVETSALLAPTVTQLDRTFRPLSLSMAGLFTIKRAAEVDAVAIKEMQSKTSYVFPVDQRLVNHTRIDALTMRVYNAGKALPQQLNLNREVLSAKGDPAHYISEELKYPITARKIQALLQGAMGQRSTTHLAERLVDITHHQLQYAENNPARGVLNALSRGYGECNDFADLLTTLARAAQIPARTVFGLAYKDGPNPVFMYHAWNELYVDHQWIAVDPTWNQTPIDATHIPLSDEQSAALMLAHTHKPIHFEVLRTSYL